MLRPWLPTSIRVRRLGTAKAEETLSFRRYLSAHHADDNLFQILASDMQQHVDCTACANCCRHSIVAVDKAEIRAIARHVGVTPEAATQLYTVPDREAPALRTLRSSSEGCVFLRGALCQIYNARPKTCRDFPYVAIGTHSLGARPSSFARWAALRPIIYNALESYKHLTGYPRARKPALALNSSPARFPGKLVFEAMLRYTSARQCCAFRRGAQALVPHLGLRDPDSRHVARRQSRRG